MPVVGAQVSDTAGQAGYQAVDRQGFEDYAGRERQYLAVGDPQQPADRRAGFGRRLPTLFAGSGIGDAGIDDQRAQLAAQFQVAAADVHRRGAKAVGSEHAGHSTAAVERQQGQVAPVRLADSRLGDAETNAGNRPEIGGGRGTVINGHGRLANGVWQAATRSPPATSVVLAASAVSLRTACRDRICTSCPSRRGRGRYGRPLARQPVV